MRANAVVTFIAAGALGALTVAGCDEEGAPLAGTWVRTKVVGDASGPHDSDTWTLVLRADGTFSMRHEHLENGVSMTSIYDSMREGTYSVHDDGRISFSGGWMDGTVEATSLEDVAASYKSIEQDTMYVLSEDGRALFIGPDFDADSAYTTGDSYDILFPAGQNTYSRASSLLMTDASGAIVEQRDESYTYAVNADETCSIQYAFTTVNPSATGSGVVSAESCSYEFGESQEVAGVDGAAREISLVTFDYTIEGDERREYFAMVDDVLVSYTPSQLEALITGNAFVKTSD